MASSLLSLDVGLSDKDSKRRKKKKSRKAREVDDTPLRRGVIYVGHLPHGFYETQLRGYFSQFGKVTKVHVSRNKKVPLLVAVVVAFDLGRKMHTTL